MPSLRVKVPWVGAGLALAVVGLSAAADSWIEVRSPHFTVVSNAGERTARNIAWQFEQFRSAIEKGWPWARVQLSRPITVIAAKDESTMRALAPRYELARLVLSGTPSAAAIEQVFGSMKALDTAYQMYVGQGVFRYTAMKVDTTVSAKDFQARPLSGAESAAARAGFHAAMARPIEARAEIEQIRKSDPRATAADEIEAKLLEREQKAEQARQAFATAAEHESDNFYVYFRLAGLTWKPDADAQTLQNLQQWLTRSVALNDAYAPASGFLASVLLQLNRATDALGPARRALALEPDETSYRLTLAEGLWRTSQTDEALKEARTALAEARTETQRRDAQRLLDSFAARAAIK